MSARITVFYGGLFVFQAIFSTSFSYNDIMKKHSRLCKRLMHSSPEQLMALLVGAEAKNRVTITNVPACDGKKTQVTLDLEQHSDSSLHVFLKDMHNNNVIQGRLNPKDGDAYLSLLMSTPQQGSGVLGPNEKKRLISGTTALMLWDRFWQIWGIKNGYLNDASMYDGFYLRILLPYVHGHSWYGEYGYFPQDITEEEYDDAVSFLTGRSVHALYAECADVPAALDVLDAALAFTSLDVTATLGELVKTLYAGWRYESLQKKGHSSPACKEILRGLYDTFLANYPVENEQVLRAHAIVNWSAHLKKTTH